MNNRRYRLLMTSVAGIVLVSSVGCASLPWRAKKVAATVSPAGQYAPQTVESIEYDNSIDFAKDYQPSSVASSTYTTPTRSSSTASSSSSGSCSSGCCK